MEKRDTWSKVSVIANVMSAILIPALVLVFGAKITSQQHQAQVFAEARADFDKNIVNDVITMHRKIESHIRLRAEQYDNEIIPETDVSDSFYREISLDLSSLRLRFMASRYESISIEQIESLEKLIAAMEKVERVDGWLLTPTSSDRTEIIRSVMDTQFAAILKLELAKIRGPATEDRLTE